MKKLFRNLGENSGKLRKKVLEISGIRKKCGENLLKNKEKLLWKF